MTIDPWRALRRFSVLVLLIAAMVSPDLSSQGRRGRGQVLIDGREAVEGEVLVRFRNAGATFERARAEADVEADEVEALGLRGTVRMRARRLGTSQLLARLRANPDVEFVEPNYIIRLEAAPNDPSFGSLWGLLNSGQDYGGVGLAGADVDAALAWDVSTGARNTVVGIVDSGIDYTHPDLAANIWTAPSAFSVTVGGVVINCAAGTHGFNAITNTCNPMDDNNHGTHVAGTIGAVGNNAVGVVGINWQASMMGLKILDSTGSGTTANAIKAIEFAVQAKAVLGTAVANVRVLSNSWSGGGFSQSLLNEINRTAAADMLFVASAGNSGVNTDIAPAFPGSYSAPNLITVAATNNLDERAGFSNYGAATVHLGAPGVYVLSTTINNTYSVFSGTSMAAPHVSGAAALLLSACSLTTAGLKAALLTAVDPIPGLAGLTTSGGRLNINNAIRVCPQVPVSVPNAVGLTQAAATASITGAGLVVGTVGTVNSTTVAAGLVISQSPSSGSSVARGSTVDLIVSLGPASAQIALSGDLGFGAVQVGVVATRTLAIHNPGTATLTVSGLSYPVGFSGNWAGGSIGAGATQNVTVSFGPAAVSSYGGTVIVTGNHTSGINTVPISGTGFAPLASSASYVSTNSTTQGTWKGAYGADGWAVAAVGTSNPAYGVVKPSGHSSWVWDAMTGAAQALQYPAGTDRIAATWYEVSFTIDVSLTDGQPHQVALYGVDWDLRGRSQRIDVLDAATGAVLDTQTVSNFGTGQYWVWQVRGAVRFRVTRLAGPNAVISGVFVGGASTGGAPLVSSASYVSTNSTTQGTWKGTYGADGWALATVGTSNPAYGVVTPSGHSSWVWNAMTGAAQALQYPAGTDRIAATWYELSFTIDVNLTDGQPHQVALYGVDWDLRGRSQRIDVLDAATGAVLDTQTLSNFGTGQYWVWQVRGAVRFRVTALTGANAVISGVFVDGASTGDGRHQ